MLKLEIFNFISKTSSDDDSEINLQFQPASCFEAYLAYHGVLANQHNTSILIVVFVHILDSITSVVLILFNILAN